MILRSIKILIFLLGFTNTIFAQTISEIEILANSAYDDDFYEGVTTNYLNIKFEESMEDSISKRLQKLLTSEGYFHSNISFDMENQENDSSKALLKIIIKEYNPTLINNIEFEKNNSVSQNLFDEYFGFLIQERFIQTEVESAIDIMLDYYSNTGFPFAEIEIKSVFFHKDSTENQNLVDIFLDLNKNGKQTIDQFKIVGNEKTRDFVIIRNSGIERNSLYSQRQIEKIKSNLNKLDFFNSVSDPKYYISNNKGILELTVKEKSTNHFDGIIGYVPQTTNRDGYFTGFVNFNFRNLFGTERTFSFRWEKETSETQELELKYYEPWLAGYPFNLQFELFQRKQDTTYVNRKYNAELEFRASANFTASTLFEYTSTIPSDNGDIFTVYNSNTVSTGFKLMYDSRNDLYSPTSGFLLENVYFYNKKNINGPSQFINQSTETSINFQRYEIKIQSFYEIFNRNVIALKFSGNEIQGENVEFSDLYRLGGTNTLRGYIEKQFAGNRVFWSNLEYRYLISPKTFLFAFFDVGYFKRKANKFLSIPESSDYKSGYGFGLNLESGLGILAISYALGEEDSFSNGKIHFGLVNQF